MVNYLYFITIFVSCYDASLERTPEVYSFSVIGDLGFGMSYKSLEFGPDLKEPSKFEFDSISTHLSLEDRLL